MGVCLTSACISLAIARLTRSIWRSLQGSPLLPSPSLGQPSMAQIDLVATVSPQFGPHPGPRHYVIFNLDLSHITWHLPPSCSNLLSCWSEKSTPEAFSLFFSLPLCLFFLILLILLILSLTLLSPCSHSLLAPVTLSISHSYPPVFLLRPLSIRLMWYMFAYLCVCYEQMKQEKILLTGIWWHQVTHSSFSMTPDRQI